ncbi:MAG TPA: Crp/Fnr family transcriptional regulator [Myxococcota bacterium]|nr:Crp/Fnr family transcriptional regulator [Myxococcota bacterium]HQK51274.1 Crp/Fnr family transcriptional regulator [Myxococcota bacterium]
MGSPSHLPCGQLTSPALLRLLLEIGEDRSFRRGERLVEEGDPPALLGVVREGRVRIARLGADGRDLTLHVVGPGEAFGIIPALDGAPYPASVEAMTDGRWSRVWSRRFLEALRGDSNLALEALRTFGGRIRHLIAVGHENAMTPVPNRLASRLLEMAVQEVEVRLTRRELADLAGTTVETAIRITRQWERQGWVSLARGRITIRNREALASLAEEDRPSTTSITRSPRQGP